ncbi:monovalent cation/H(+) antiporter subunit G [Actinotignum urinale]|uniref:Monovalent cation/H(+) antiporter subunit G n=1 Tax=Actinotignum urinale TaxID=190146 RepID=A0AAW9HMG7_9ACTO|nr:monovalent cation/H(+) antiporter subunit G [Actinotignum urinale]MDY5128546.1 monovalent cation/H(+) antiporter subunit G [Actinotignum urinale]MDY5132619.1 monovalent cation/H(+) antiporter subunit G [Actinotignum urinale]MDY5151290.1 monovalent cation/H(+) antiporter subunit G [Actinotignum urinale]MDY5155090.1 monovalent cation/H(+) antiporter subunit G [Actinotignum urinale]MDY5160635.1 monovalent cation/H(+) antiporter subunit G [Actinotignum urinale]
MVNVWDVVGAVFLVAGCVLTFVSAVGMFRYPDLMTRLHVATKPQVLSLIFCFIGAAFLVRDTSMTWTMILVIFFQLVTSPISAHMLSRSGYRTGRIESDDLVVDELREDLRFARSQETPDIKC